MIGDHKGDSWQGRAAVVDESNIKSITGPIVIGQKQWRGERDDYWRGKRPNLSGCIGWGTEFPEPPGGHTHLTVCRTEMGPSWVTLWKPWSIGGLKSRPFVHFFARLFALQGYQRCPNYPVMCFFPRKAKKSPLSSLFRERL